MRTIRRLLAITVMMLLTGCVAMPTGPTVHLVPQTSKPPDQFLSEVTKCRETADRQMGRYDEYFSTEDAQRHYNNVYAQCMQSFGNYFQRPEYRRNTLVPPPSTMYNNVPPDYVPQSGNSGTPVAPKSRYLGTPPPGRYSIPPPGTHPPD